MWLLALGYFLCYAMYSGVIKHVTQGVNHVSGLQLLPSVTLGTAITLPLLITCLGWWRYVPRLDRSTVISGIATGIIIVTTTLAYTFDGVSIVFALLLLRGGVLILAPIVDVICGREVRWVCWLALLCSIAAIVVALAKNTDTRMTIVAGLNACAYIAAYAVRLRRMTCCAKVADQQLTRGWFIGELMVAIVIQLLLPLLGALTPSMFGARLRSGIVDMSATGVLIGVLYGGLYFFGTSVYLNRRENSFCVSLNRGASLLAGVTAALVIGKTPTLPELAAVSLIVVALLCLCPLHHLPHAIFDRMISKRWWAATSRTLRAGVLVRGRMIDWRTTAQASRCKPSPWLGLSPANPLRSTELRLASSTASLSPSAVCYSPACTSRARPRPCQGRLRDNASRQSRRFMMGEGAKRRRRNVLPWHIRSYERLERGPSSPLAGVVEEREQHPLNVRVELIGHDPCVPHEALVCFVRLIHVDLRDEIDDADRGTSAPVRISRRAALSTLLLLSSNDVVLEAGSNTPLLPLEDFCWADHLPSACCEPKAPCHSGR